MMTTPKKFKMFALVLFVCAIQAKAAPPRLKVGDKIIEVIFEAAAAQPFSIGYEIRGLRAADKIYEAKSKAPKCKVILKGKHGAELESSECEIDSFFPIDEGTAIKGADKRTPGPHRGGSAILKFHKSTTLIELQIDGASAGSKSVVFK